MNQGTRAGTRFPLAGKNLNVVYVLCICGVEVFGREYLRGLGGGHEAYVMKGTLIKRR